MRSTFATAWLATLAAVGLAVPAIAPRVRAAPPAPLAPLAPGQHACPAVAGALALKPDLSGYGLRSTGDPPVLLSPTLVVYLQTARRPVPHVTAVVAATTAGASVWQHALAPTADPGGLAVLDGAVDVAVRTAGGAEVEALGAAGGAVRVRARLAWPEGGPAPALTPDGRSGLLASGSPADLPAALSGLGRAAPPVVDLGPNLAVRWRAARVGDLVALGAGVAVVARRLGPAGATVRLTGLSVATGRSLWTVDLAPGAAPATASFAVSEGILVWAFTASGGGAAGAIALGSGAALWQVPNTDAAWIAAAGAAVAGPSPWQPPVPVVARALRTGAVLWRGPAAAPVAAFGGRILAVTATTGPKWLWLSPPSDPRAANRASATIPAGAAGAAPLPPVAVYCGGGAGRAAVLVAPDRGADLWTVAVASAVRSGR